MVINSPYGISFVEDTALVFEDDVDPILFKESAEEKNINWKYLE